MKHKNQTGAEAIHQSAYVQSSDPGAVGALKAWIDTTTDPALHKVRNATNDGWIQVGVATGSGTDHGSLTGLGDDDHTQYQLRSEKDQNSGYAGLNSSGRVPVARLASGTPDGTKFVRDDGALAIPSGTGVTDHGALTGLSDDDHTQYHTDARGDARYYTQSEVDALIAGVGGGGPDVGTVILSSNAVNNNASAATWQQAGNLEFDVTANVMYSFRVILAIQTASTSNGGKFGINGPTLTRLHYNQIYPNAIATSSYQPLSINLTAYREMSMLSGFGNTTNQMILMEGFIECSASGAAYIEFASELSNTALTILAGSRIIYWGS